jgi:hypothetical protein
VQTALLELNALIDSLLFLTHWNKLAVFLSAFLGLYVVRKCLLSKQVRLRQADCLSARSVWLSRHVTAPFEDNLPTY